MSDPIRMTPLCINALTADLTATDKERADLFGQNQRQRSRIAQLEAALEKISNGEGVGGLAMTERLQEIARQALPPVSALCAVCDQIKELHPSTHPWMARDTTGNARRQTVTIYNVVLKHEDKTGSQRVAVLVEAESNDDAATIGLAFGRSTVFFGAKAGHVEWLEAYAIEFPYILRSEPRRKPVERKRAARKTNV